MDDPTDISRLEGTQPEARVLRLAVLESCANVAHRFREPLSRALVDGKEERVDLRTGGGVGRGEGFPARFGEGQNHLLAMLRAHAALRQPARAEPREDPAQMRLVHP